MVRDGPGRMSSRDMKHVTHTDRKDEISHRYTPGSSSEMAHGLIYKLWKNWVQRLMYAYGKYWLWEGKKYFGAVKGHDSFL